MVSVQTQIESQGDLSLANLSRKIDEINLPKEILKITLTKLQDELILELCGPVYKRDANRQFQRAAATNRTLKTRHGQIQFKLAVVRNLENSSYFRPLLTYLGVYSRQRIVNDLDLECAKAATYLTYRDSKTVIENLTNAEVSKDRIHSCVQKVGDFMKQERRKPKNTTTDEAEETEEEKEVRVVDLMLGDGTKVHGCGGVKNDVCVLLGKNEVTGEKEFLGFGVNTSWREVALQFEGRAKVAVSDNESSLRKVLLERSGDYQACVLHCIRDVRFYLWSAGLSKVERKDISSRVEVCFGLCSVLF
jgi:transposase-like protein